MEKYFKKIYNCQFCSACEGPLKEYNQCRNCNQTFHMNCTHGCKVCKYCKENKCFTQLYDLKKRIKIFKKVEREIDLDNYLNIKSVYKTTNEIVDYYKNKLYNKEENEKSLDIKNKGYINEIINENRKTIFFNKEYFVNNCLICKFGFHTSNKNKNICDECFYCYNCNKKFDTKVNKYDETIFKIYKTFRYRNNDIFTDNILYCNECYNNYIVKNEICPICIKSYTEDDMIECEWCHRWVHYECEADKNTIRLINAEKYKDTYKCEVCKVFELLWVGEEDRNTLFEKNKIKHENAEKKSGDDFSYSLNIFDENEVAMPICSLCPKEFNWLEQKIIRLVKLHGSNTTQYAHNICAISATNIQNNKYIVKRLKQRCSHCKKPDATFKCIFCKNDYYHFDCTFFSKNDLFRSNLIIPICETHYDEHMENISVIIQQYYNSNYYLHDNDDFDNIRINDFIMAKNNTFIKLFYLENEIVSIKCNFENLYFNDIKMTHNEIIYKCKEFNLKINLEEIVQTGEELLQKYFKSRFINKLSNKRYNLCIDKKYQINNFTLTYINQVLSTKKDIYLGDSKIHGKGIFAKRFFYPNEIILNYEGEIISNEEANRREFKYGINTFYMFKASDHVIDATIKGNFAKFINQSCSPNCYATEAIWNNKKGILICAKTFITVNEELTYKYGFYGEKMNCNCQTINCKSTNKNSNK